MVRLLKIIEDIGLPFAYSHFAEGESPDPPFMVYLFPKNKHFGADGVVFYKNTQIDLELYTDKKDVGEATDNKQYPNSYSLMARCIKRAKDPKADKFDPMVIFGFSILGGPSKKIVPYLYKERKKPLRASVGKSTISFSQAEFTKLPTFMLEEERVKFSTEQRQLILNQEKKPSKFFLRWSRDVLLPNSVYEKLKGRDGLIFKNDLINEKR